MRKPFDASFEQVVLGLPEPAPMPRTAPRRTRAARRVSSPAPDVRQEPLPLAHKIDEGARMRLQRRISAHMRGELTVKVTDNRYSIISIKRDKPRYEARLHHMFIDAEPLVVRALARYIVRNDSSASTLLNEYIERHQHKIRRAVASKPRSVNLNLQGEFFHLGEIYDALNGRYFNGSIDVRITWGRRRTGAPRRHSSIKMGSYSVEDRLIRIHPSLDRPFVPRFFIESVVFHEMLHSVHEIPVVAGRHCFHTPAFRADERKFELYEASRRWEKENLSRLLYF